MGDVGDQCKRSSTSQTLSHLRAGDDADMNRSFSKSSLKKKSLGLE
jgi:hypothetical protein